MSKRNAGHGLKPFRPGCIAALTVEADIRLACARQGIRLRTSIPVSTGGTPTLHWSFRDLVTGRLLLDYWPGTGKVMLPSGHRGQVADARHALTLSLAVRRGEPVEVIMGRLSPVGEVP